MIEDIPALVNREQTERKLVTNKYSLVPLLNFLLLLLTWNPGETFDRALDDDRCKRIRPYRKCETLDISLDYRFFDLPVGTLTSWGCFSDDMNSVCSDFGICERTKRYVIRGDAD